METLVKTLTSSGATAFELVLVLALLFGIVALWRAQEKLVAKISDDGPMMAGVVRDATAKLGNLAAAIEEQNRTREIMISALAANTHEIMRLRDLIEHEGKLNRQAIGTRNAREGL